MDKQYGEFVGVDSLYYALITKDDEAEYTAGTPEYLAPAAEISGEAETNNTTTYYDNKPGNNYVSEGATALAITVANLPAKKMAVLLGKHFDEATGQVFDSGEPIPPDVALGFRYNMGKGEYRYYWYYKGTFSGGTEEAGTKSNDVDVRTYQLTYTAVTTTHEWVIDGEKQSLKRTFGDTAEATFNPIGWFTSVRTPVVTP
jgi:phi13 family phage major tail protein